jgi:SAM-dependent methyltransferase
MKNFKYTGTREIELISDNAKCYNDCILSFILKYAPKKGKILDIGAGLGYYAQKLKTKGYDIACMEPYEEHYKRTAEIGLSVVRSMDEVEDGSLDFIYSINVLEHIEDDDEALKVWTKKLKPGGYVFIWLPAFTILYSSFDKLIGHFRRYRKKTLANKIGKAGLLLKKARYSDSMGFFTTLLYKWIRGNTNRGNGKVSKTEVIIFDKLIFPINRILDPFCSNTFGKNIWCVAQKRGEAAK